MLTLEQLVLVMTLYRMMIDDVVCITLLRDGICWYWSATAMMGNANISKGMPGAKIWEEELIPRMDECTAWTPPPEIIKTKFQRGGGDCRESQ